MVCFQDKLLSPLFKEEKNNSREERKEKRGWEGVRTERRGTIGCVHVCVCNRAEVLVGSGSP